MATAFNKTAICPIFIGRTTDLATLHQLIEQVKGGRGHVALLSVAAGDRGLLSRLLAVARQLLSHGSCH
jgi:hypothetical protein